VGEIENDCASHNDIILFIFLPEIIKVWKLDEVVTSRILPSFYVTWCTL